ncbi:hypothetical protein [Streptomyces microflavus]
MTGMNDILDALWSMEFGAALLGALAGGGFTMLGSWLQSKSGSKAATLALARANAQRAFDTMTQFMIVMTAQEIEGIGTRSSRAAWNRERATLVTMARSAVALLPDEYKATRSRTQHLLSLLGEWRGTPVWDEYKLGTGVILTETIRTLGTFVRGSAVPEPRDVQALIRQELAAHRKTEAEQELERLNWAAANQELDEDDMERAEELREQLGIPHPTPSGDDSQNAQS